MRIRSNYIGVTKDDTVSYGGNQRWLKKKMEQQVGCGLIAATDLLLYLQGKRELTEEEYLRQVAKYRKYFLFTGPLGINGLTLLLGVRLCLWKEKLSYDVSFGCRPKLLRRAVERMLSRDLPVIFSVGPDFPLMFLAHKLDLYRKNEKGEIVKAGKVSRHYMTITGLSGDEMEVSSWGGKYYMSWKEYEKLASRRSLLLSSILYIRPKKRVRKKFRKKDAV